MDGWSTLARGVREKQLAAARCEGVIEGLERALRLVSPFVTSENSDLIRNHIERLRAEQKEG